MEELATVSNLKNEKVWLGSYGQTIRDTSNGAGAVTRINTLRRMITSRDERITALQEKTERLRLQIKDLEAIRDRWATGNQIESDYITTVGYEELKRLTTEEERDTNDA